MKSCLAQLLILASLALAGCDSLPSQSGGRVGPPPETSRVFEADPKAVYEAALVSLAQMDFRVTGGGAAQGKITAVSGLRTNVNLQTTRQITMKAEIKPWGEGSTMVEVVLKEAVEEDPENRLGFATETALRDTPYYEVFLNGIQQALSMPKKD